ncbi:hypothetical protein J4Q44_G00362620 [Coregonus suidteri]|uniref:Metalloproteinase inhibitor 2 n=1 Tax=Coregonus suidteri TaxID=861788 RepID=A0AAN8KWL7_9TELE
MARSVSSCFITLVVLFLWRVEDVAEACRCRIVHPQQAFCRADVVIRAKVDEVGAGSGNTKYDIQQIKMFKGPDRDINAVFTPTICRKFLETNKEYLLTGRLNTDGTMNIMMCDFSRTWEASSDTQLMRLIQRYQSGCDCKIIPCSSLSCPISSPDECLWTDWLSGNGLSGPQTQSFACLKRRDGSCAWYSMSAQPEK